jgi:hypothetical protein
MDSRGDGPHTSEWISSPKLHRQLDDTCSACGNLHLGTCSQQLAARCWRSSYYMQYALIELCLHVKAGHRFCRHLRMSFKTTCPRGCWHIALSYIPGSMPLYIRWHLSPRTSRSGRCWMQLRSHLDNIQIYRSLHIEVCILQRGSTRAVRIRKSVN